MAEQAQHSILVHYGEIGLKGKNQPAFRRQLRENVRLKLKQLGLDWRVKTEPGLISIQVPPQNASALEPVLEKLRQVFGIVWMTRARRLPHRGFTADSEEEDFAALESELAAIAREQFVPGKTFAVRARRGEKRLPFTTPELERRLGAVILKNTEWKQVNLSQPDTTFHVDARHDAFYFYGDKIKGPGGLPVGSSGRVLVLLSGGIDSPAAAYLMAKRGCQVDFIHFTATSMQQDEAQRYKVWQLAEKLSQFTLRSRLHLVPYVRFDVAMLEGNAEYDLILFRRFMARTAETLAERIEAEALASGDNLSQVASQTLSNLVSTSQATALPILRPLIGFDKEEIIELAQRIGTYELSIEPYKDCCALISRRARTSSRHRILSQIEARIFPDYQKLIDQTLADSICLEAGGNEECDRCSEGAGTARAPFEL